MTCHTWTFYVLPNIPNTSHFTLNQCKSNVQNMGSYLPTFLTGLNSPHTNGWHLTHVPKLKLSTTKPAKQNGRFGWFLTCFTPSPRSWQHVLCYSVCVVGNLVVFVNKPNLYDNSLEIFIYMNQTTFFVGAHSSDRGQVVIHSTNFCC